MVYAAQFVESNAAETQKETQSLYESDQVAGPSRPRVEPEQPAKTKASSMSEASFRSLQRKLKALEEEKKQEAANILASMTSTIAERAQTTHDEVLETTPEREAEEPPMGSSGSGTLASTSSTLVEVSTEKRKLRPRKEKGESRRVSLRVAAKPRSKVTVKVPKHTANKGPNMQGCYNKFRARVIALVGTEGIKAFQAGTFQANVAFLWQQLTKEEQVAFDGRDEVEQRAMLEKMMHPAESEIKVGTVAKKQKKTEVVKSPRPKRNVVGAKN